MSLDELDRHLDRLRRRGWAVAVLAVALGAGSGAAAWGWARWLGDDLLDRRDSASLAKFLALSGIVVFGLFALGLRTWMRRLAELQNELHELAFHDPLTGARNRHKLDGHLAQLDQRMAEGYTVSMLVADLDHFKRVNDQYGHATGDAVLREVAARLEAVLRREDVLYRLGGEEFLVIVQGVSADASRLLADRLRAAIGDLPIAALRPGERLTISIGLAVSSEFPECDARHLLALADRAMYDAKRAGRNCVRVAGAAADRSVFQSTAQNSP